MHLNMINVFELTNVSNFSENYEYKKYEYQIFAHKIK